MCLEFVFHFIIITIDGCQFPAFLRLGQVCVHSFWFSRNALTVEHYANKIKGIVTVLVKTLQISCFYLVKPFESVALVQHLKRCCKNIYLEPKAWEGFSIFLDYSMIFR